MQFPLALTFDDVLLVPAHSDVLPAQAQLGTVLGRGVALRLPLLSAAMDTVTEAPMAIAMARAGALGVLHKNNTIEAQCAMVQSVKAQRGDADASCDEAGGLRVAAAVGVGDDGAQRLAALVQAGVDVAFIDTAHGHSAGVLTAVRRARAAHPQLLLGAGNVATAAATEALIDAGADLIKVGIGPGSICTTRVMAGIGVPQLTAVLECAAAARQRGARVVADGGVRFSGDVVKALAAGAHAVMSGSLFAGTDEAPGAPLSVAGQKYKAYRGMGSAAAMQRGSADRYFQEAQQPAKLVPEGVEARLPAKGPLGETLAMLIGGLRAGMGYLGAADLAALCAAPRFVQISAAGYRESHVHDVTVTRADPNS